MISALPEPQIDYPETDDMPMAENTTQFEWIVTIKCGLDEVFKHVDDVFVAGDLFWYPVERHPEIRMAPDVLAALGRPKGHRGSYLQWKEGNVPPQVIFEILSPGNRVRPMIAKFKFYERYGVQEYYVYDPDDHELAGWQRDGDSLQAIADLNGWKSPLLGITFDQSASKLRILGPDGKPFLTYAELADLREAEHKARIDAEQKAAEVIARSDRLAAQLRAMGIDPDV